jgi:diacylglycerol kinase (ATP)
VKTRLVINPVSGHGNARRAVPAVLAELQKRIGSFEVRFTERPKDGIRLAREAAQEQVARLLVLGGDGTTFEVVNGLVEMLGEDRLHQIQLGLIPVGTGNSFLRDFDLLHPTQAIERITQNVCRRVDVMRFQAAGAPVAYSLNILGVGFIADVCDITNKRFKGLGANGYIVGTFATLAGLQSPLTTIWLDGEAQTTPACLVTLSNSRCTGGDMQIAPNAKVDDGLIEVMIAKDFGRLELAMLFPKIFSGAHLTHPKIEMRRAKKIQIESQTTRVVMPDGEILGTTPLTCEILPGALSLLA